MKKTLVLGASPNPARIAHSAVRQLVWAGHEVVALGNREGNIDGVELIQGKPALEGIDTITLYLNPRRQQEYYDYLLSLKPRRIIFNPGAENRELAQLAREQGIEVEMACTLVMLSMQAY